MPIILSGVAGDATVFFDISAVLDNRLNIMPDLPPVAWPNDEYEPVNGTLYLRPTNIQGDTVAITDQDETIGIYQIDIFAPSSDGKYEANIMSDMIANHFKQDTSMSYLSQVVRVRNVSKRTISNNENGWLHLSIDVKYYAFSDRR